MKLISEQDLKNIIGLFNVSNSNSDNRSILVVYDIFARLKDSKEEELLIQLEEKEKQIEAMKKIENKIETGYTNPTKDV